METDLLLLLRLVVASLLAGVMGWERERAGKAAGLRTHILVGVAAALYVAVADALLAAYAPATAGSMRLDPLRAVDAVATGIGFLGAGIIFVARERDHVKNLTTAASIWATAAVGVAVGYGYYVLAGGATLLLYVVLHVLDRLPLRQDPKKAPDPP